LGKAVAEYEAQAGKLSAEAAVKVQEVRRLIELGDVAAAAARLQSIKAGIPASSRLAPAKSQPGFSDAWVATYTYPGKLAQMSDDWANQAANASLDLGQGAQFAQSAATALRSVGIKPLEGDKLVQSISTLANKPEFAGNDVLAGAVKNVADDIAKWTSNGGVIDAKALEAIRKNSVNAAIAKLRPGVDATSQRNLAAGVMSKIKPMIDDAIEGSGGTGWREYLDTHAKGMQKIAEKKLTGEAFDLYKNNKDAFVRLVQNESPEVVEKFLGPGKYNIALELADGTMGVLRNEASRHLNRVAAGKQATEGQKALATLVAQNTSAIRLPSLVNAWAAAGNKTISELEKRLGAKTTKKLSDAMQNPQTAADLLSSVPASERNRIVQMLNNPGAAGTRAAAIMPTNALAPQSENQNALVK
jgi:antitoxin (DNA-binding transcriptional repressor) of toxin-antitoxin stability system